MLKKYNYLFFTTCDAKQERIEDLTRLLSSIDDSIANQRLSVKHYILLQNANEVPISLLSLERQDRVFLFYNSQLSLSRARNVMIKQAFNNNDFSKAEICAFPDDDAWYPLNFLGGLKKYMQSHLEISVFTCDYGSEPEALLKEERHGISHITPGTVASFIRTVSSNTLFLRADLAEDNQFFDERLGVGAQINGGEDLDYALRAYTKAKSVAISRLKLVGHRDRMKWVRSRYYAGSLFAIARGARLDIRIFSQMIRKLMVGLYFVLKKEMTLTCFLSSAKVGLTGFFVQTVNVNNFD